VLPKDLEPLLAETRLFATSRASYAGSADALAVVREALTSQRRLQLRYANERGEETDRVVRPLGVFFWGKTWTLAAWCEMRVAFRNFRLDRVAAATLGERFDEEPGRTLRDMLAQYGPEAVKLLDR
jgi:predicted DNA-binding transcriptional regulator YafY